VGDINRYIRMSATSALDKSKHTRSPNRFFKSHAASIYAGSVREKDDMSCRTKGKCNVYKEGAIGAIRSNNIAKIHRDGGTLKSIE
jgi:hypothetical protein